MDQPPRLPEPVTVAVNAKPALMRRLLPWLIAGIPVLTLLAWWDGRAQVDELRREMAQRLAENDGRLQEGRAQFLADHDAVAALQQRVGQLEATLAETRGRADAMETLVREVARGRDERLLADIEQTLALALQQLQLGGNAEAALIALQAAEARLAGSAQPRFVPLRRLLARDIERLKALPVADLSGLSLRIEGVVAALDSLPLAFEHRPQPGADTPASAPAAPGDAGLVQRFGRELWHEVRQLLRIERIDGVARGEAALLAPAQSAFLRENLRLRLLSARLALLQRDTAAYRADLRRTRDLLERYFDTRAKPVQTALATLAQLAEINPAPDLPALAETLAAARKLQLPRERGG